MHCPEHNPIANNKIYLQRCIEELADLFKQRRAYLDPGWQSMGKKRYKSSFRSYIRSLIKEIRIRRQKAV